MSKTLREAVKLALDVLENLQRGCIDSDDGTVDAITVWCPDVCDALRAALADQAQAEPVYQARGADGRWIDQERKSYDYNAKHGQAVRVLYTAPQPAAQPIAWHVRMIGCDGSADWVALGDRPEDVAGAEILPMVYADAQPLRQSVAEDPPQWLPPSLFGAWDRMQGQRVEAQAQPVAVPEGYALVPVDPTPEMVKAGTGWGTARSTWRAMLSAAPKVQP